MELTGLFKFIKYFGSQQAAADAIGVKQQAISNWLVRGSIPYKQILKIICVTKGIIQPSELAPNDQELSQLIDELAQLCHDNFSQDPISNVSSNSHRFNTRSQPIVSLTQEVSIHNDNDELALLLPFCKQASIQLILSIHEDKMTREYSKISPQFWLGKTGREILKLSVEARFLALYLMTCPHANMIGIYYLPVAYIAHDTKINEDTISRALDELIQVSFCSYDESAEYVWLHEMAKYQVGNYLEEKDKRVKGINNIFRSLPDLIFLKDFYEKYQDAFHLQPRKEIFKTQEKNLTPNPTTSVVNEENDPFKGASKALQSQEQEQEQYQEQEQKQEQGEQEQEEKHRRVLRQRQADESEKNFEPTPSIISPLGVVIAIPLRDGSSFEISQAMINEWQELYASLDVLQQLKNIRGWNLANPGKRKSCNSVLQHINQWLTKENLCQAKQSKPGGFNLFDHNAKIAKEWASEDQSFEIELQHEAE